MKTKNEKQNVELERKIYNLMKSFFLFQFSFVQEIEVFGTWLLCSSFINICARLNCICINCYCKYTYNSNVATLS